MLRVVRLHPRDEKRVFFDQLYAQKPHIDKGSECLLAFRKKTPVAALTLRQVEGFGGLISHYTALESEAGVLLLRTVIERALQLGEKRLLGPMGSSFWGEWGEPLPRLVGDPNPYPDTFFGEPQGNSAYVNHWKWAGFVPIMQSYALVCSQLFSSRPKVRQLREHLKSCGEEVRCFDEGKKTAQLRTLFELYEVFRRSQPFASFLSEEDFESGIEELCSLLDPKFLFFSYHKEKAVGFCFAHRDTVSSNRLIVRALYSKPKGLRHRAILVDQLHKTAYEEGIDLVIHAMVPEEQGWHQLVKTYFEGEVFRRYQLFGYALQD